MTQTAIPQKKSNAARYLVIAAIIVLAFFVSYRFALGRSAGQSFSAAGVASAAPATAGSAGVDAAGAGGGSGAAGTSGSNGAPACACCGGASGSSAPVQGAAKLDGSVQRISIDTSAGSYNPNVIKLKAGVPAELTFGRVSGCLGQVISSDLGFSEDLTTGAKTVKLPALTAGTYSFSCGMQMVYGSIVVQ